MSHDLLEDLLADVPRHVVPDADRAWRAGIGRRRRRYAAEGLAVAIAAVFVGFGLVQLHDRTPVQPVDKTVVVDGHPREVPRPYFERDVPKAPGPAAGVIQTDGAWHLIDARGHSWRQHTAGGYVPVLSADGTKLAVMANDGQRAGHLEVRNLVTGSVQSYPDVGQGSTEYGVPVTDQKFWVQLQAPGFWSPDGARLLLYGGSVDVDEGGALLLEDGNVRALPWRGLPVGWHSPSTVAWYAAEDNTVVLTRLDGSVERRVPLQADSQLAVDQWGVQVSPDGTRIAMLENSDGTALRVFSLATGRELPVLAHDPHGQHPGPPVWRGDDVLWWDEIDLVDPKSGTTVVSLSERWKRGVIAVWSPQSAAGPAHDGPSALGWRYWPLWRWWTQLLIGVGVLVVGLGIWWFTQRDRKKLARRT